MNLKEIWWVDFNPSIGAEMNKVRPCLIVSVDAIGALPLRVVVPITDWNERYAAAAWHVKLPMDGINNLAKDSTADCFQVRSVSTNRFKGKMGEIDDDTHAKIKQALKDTLGL